MNKHLVEKIFSNARMYKYFEKYDFDEAKAIIHYKVNIEVSESFYPLLSVFEVALRNSINRELIAYFKTDDWFLHLAPITGLKALNQEITKAQRLITKRGESINASKIVAELTLGFWVRLFNAEYVNILWKDLRRSFPNMLKQERKRHNVSSSLNKIRNFRNRIFHQESITWNFEFLEQIHFELYKVLGWLNKDLPDFVNPIDRFPFVLTQAKIKLKL